jgi:hypothetical protein
VRPSRADDGTRTHDLLHGKSRRTFALVRGGSLNPHRTARSGGSRERQQNPNERQVLPLLPRSFSPRDDLDCRIDWDADMRCSRRRCSRDLECRTLIRRCSKGSPGYPIERGRLRRFRPLRSSHSRRHEGLCPGASCSRKGLLLVLVECGTEFVGRKDRLLCGRRRCKDRRYARLHPDKLAAKQHRKYERRSASPDSPLPTGVTHCCVDA